MLDDLVYVYKKNVPGKTGYWEGESKGMFSKKKRKKKSLSSSHCVAF
jgi:hypothetical protein